jgi:hypothetical protein
MTTHLPSESMHGGSAFGFLLRVPRVLMSGTAIAEIFEVDGLSVIEWCE